MQADHEDLSLLGMLPINGGVEDQVTEIMKKLAARAQHRAPSIADLFVAAVARTHQATVLHYDKDFELIASATGQPQEWVVPRGTGHGRH
jgi:predicted nucleic acid-binding protein